MTCVCLVAQSCPTLCDTMDCSPPGSSVDGDSPGKNTGVGCHALLQGIFLTQGLNPGLPHCRQILYCLSHQGSHRVSMWPTNSTSRYNSRKMNLGSVGKESACNAGDLGSIPGLGRSPGEGNSYLLQSSGLQNSMKFLF